MSEKIQVTNKIRRTRPHYRGEVLRGLPPFRRNGAVDRSSLGQKLGCALRTAHLHTVEHFRFSITLVDSGVC